MINSLIQKLRFFVLLFLFIFLFQYKGYAQEDRNLYYQGLRDARKGKVDSAFLTFHRLLNNFPDSEYRQHALFGAGEYYFWIDDYYDAKRMFNRFVNNYPESEARLYAIAYLIKMAEKEEKESELEKLKQELIGSQQVSLLFREFKEHTYTSPLNKNHKALNFIDKIEIYIDDEIFAKISF
jgi:outer membrane protein assembly factor BamD (BamD/ComL family)